MRIYDRSNVDELRFPSNENGEYAKKFLVPLLKNHVKTYIENVNIDLKIFEVDGLVLPIVIADENYDDSYVVSMYTHYITYLKEELRELKNPPLEKLLALVVDVLSVYFKKAKINKVVYVNNWFLSTNLYPNISKSQLTQMTEFLAKRYPDHAIAFRSINNYSCPLFYEHLLKIDYDLIVSRQVYFAEKMKHMKKRHRKNINRDLRQMEKEGYEKQILVEEDIHKAERLLELYNFLYIDKYSQYNPRFTTSFLLLGLEESLFKLISLEKQGKIDGFLGYFHRNGVMTTPLLGYDTNLNSALYRMLTANLNLESEENDLLLHRSSGAAQFKRERGAISTTEYTAIYHKHLSFSRRLMWKVLQNIYGKIGLWAIKKYNL